MQLETVRRVSMCNLRLQIGWQIDDVDSTERALLYADTTSNTKSLGDECDLRVRGDFDAELPSSHDWA